MSDRTRGSKEKKNFNSLVPLQEANATDFPFLKFPNWVEILEKFREDFSTVLAKNNQDKDFYLDKKNLFFKVSTDIINNNNHIWKIRSDLSNLLIEYLYKEMFEYGAIGAYLKDPEIEDILLNDYTWMDIVKHGRKIPIMPTPFASEEEVKNWLKTNVFNPNEINFSRADPAASSALRDGSRIFAFTNPISENTGFAIRKHKVEVFADPEKYINNGMAPREFYTFLNGVVQHKLNIVVSGQTGSGKTTLTNFIASLIPHDDRILTLEDTRELQIQHPRVLSLNTMTKESKVGEGEEQITMRNLLKYALRLRPDRIILGEVRDSEAFDLLETLNTGHPGSITTLHANSSFEAIRRLQTMAIKSAVDFPLIALQDLIASVIDIVIQIENFNGKRRITSVAQILHKHHYNDIEAIADIRQIENNLYIKPLWKKENRADPDSEFKMVNKVSKPDLI